MRNNDKEDLAAINYLHRRFHFLEKNDIKLIYEFSNQKTQRTQRILMIIKDIRNPKCVTKVLLQKPEKAEGFLAEFQRQYFKKYGQTTNNLVGTKQNKNQSENQLAFFYYLPMDVCLSIMKFLDPYSFSNLGYTCQKLNKITRGPGSSDYFKILCVNLFEKIKPTLPQRNRYEQIRKYVLSRPNQFGPNTKNAVISKLRYYVWQMHPVPTPQPFSYFQKFGSYREIFENVPRVHYNGFYICKHQYRKQQEKDILQVSSTVHLVTYYRYIRFFCDGSVLCAVFPRKLKQQEIFEILSAQHLDKPVEQLEKMKDLMIGQYLHNNQELSIKAVKSGTLFSYQLQICSSNENRICNQLLVKKYWLKVIDQNDIIQNLEEEGQNNKLRFHYFMHPLIAKQNTVLARSSSL